MRLLSTDRLHLREITLNDAPFLFKLMNDKDWIQNIGDRGVHSVDDARNYISTRFLTSYDEKGFGFYAMTLKSNKKIIGIAGLIDRKGLDYIDIGYGLLPQYRGNGYAFEATKAIYDFGLDSLELPKIIAIVNPDNQSSINLLNKLGLHFEKMIQVWDKRSRNKVIFFRRTLNGIAFKMMTQMSTTVNSSAQSYGY